MTAYKNDYLHNKYKTAPSHKKKVKRVHASATKNTLKQPHYRLRKWLFGSSTVLVIFLIFFWQPVSDTSTVMFSSASAEIKEVGRDAGLNMRGQAVFLSNSPEFVNADTLANNCPHDDEIIEFGCYLPSSHKIYILQINDEQLKLAELTSVVHETLHAVWNDMSHDDRTTIGGELTTLYDSKTSDILMNSAKSYHREDATVFVDELHSLTGSEVELFEVSNTLQEHFSKYFFDHSKTIQANNEFNQNINSKIANIESQRDRLDAESKKLDDFQAAHLDSIKVYMQQNIYYGDIVTYNENVDAYNHNREIYNDMVTTYNTNVGSYNSARQSFIDAYSALFPNKIIPVPDAK